MPSVEHQPAHTSEAGRVVSWRRNRLREAGFAPELADRLARDNAYDLHSVLRLMDRGCPPELAARILAPLDEARTPVLGSPSTYTAR
jgi:hypothetical protein